MRKPYQYVLQDTVELVCVPNLIHSPTRVKRLSDTMSKIWGHSGILHSDTLPVNEGKEDNHYMTPTAKAKQG